MEQRSNGINFRVLCPKISTGREKLAPAGWHGWHVFATLLVSHAGLSKRDASTSGNDNNQLVSPWPNIHQVCLAFPTCRHLLTVKERKKKSGKGTYVSKHEENKYVLIDRHGTEWFFKHHALPFLRGNLDSLWFCCLFVFLFCCRFMFLFCCICFFLSFFSYY